MKSCRSFLDWLLENGVVWDCGVGWGYNFDWEAAAAFIPARTPISVVTAIVTRAFVSAYRVLGDERYLEVLRDVMSFFLGDLNRFELGSRICFSYTPVDDMMVHNANLMVAEALLRLSELFGIDEMRRFVLGAVRFTLFDQNLDGSFYYFYKDYARRRGLRNVIDNFHTGYVIYSLCEIYKAMRVEELWSGLVKALSLIHI